MNPEEQTITQEDVGTIEATGLVSEQPEMNDAQKKAAEILAARASKNAEVKPTADKATKEPKAPKEPKPEGLLKTAYRFLRDVDPALDKPNRQQNLILTAMLKLRGTEGDLKDVVVKEDLMKELTAEYLGTRQPPDRVLAFYLNGWKKDFEGTDKKPAVPKLLEVIKIQFKN